MERYCNRLLVSGEFEFYHLLKYGISSSNTIRMNVGRLNKTYARCWIKMELNSFKTCSILPYSIPSHQRKMRRIMYNQAQTVLKFQQKKTTIKMFLNWRKGKRVTFSILNFIERMEFFCRRISHSGSSPSSSYKIFWVYLFRQRMWCPFCHWPATWATRTTIS